MWTAISKLTLPSCLLCIVDRMVQETATICTNPWQIQNYLLDVERVSVVRLDSVSIDCTCNAGHIGEFSFAARIPQEFRACGPIAANDQSSYGTHA